VDALIAVTDDGIATLRVEQQLLEWVLEEIAKQRGWPDLKQRTVAAKPADLDTAAGQSDPSCPNPLAAAQATKLLKKIERGSELDRYDGLLQARSKGVSVPDDMLKTMFETDASERVRLLAFEGYLEARTGDADATRTALEAALYVPSSSLQGEAQRRLDEMVESERIDALSVQRAAR